MKNIKIFMLGMISIILFIPIIESLAEIICTFLEYIKGLATKPVLKISKDIVDLQAEQEPVSTQCMGFEYNEPEYFEFDDDDDYEDKANNKVKCGFY